MVRHAKFAPRLALGVAIAVAALFAVGCGSNSGGSGAQPASSAKLTGSPIKIMAVGTFSGPFATPESKAAMTAEVDWVNATGGIDGHPVEVYQCDSQGNPNIGLACYRQGVSDHVVAELDLLAFTDDFPVTDAAHIPTIEFCACFAGATTDKGSFPLQGLDGVYAAIGDVMAAHGCTSVGAIVSVTATDEAVVAGLTSGLRAHGLGPNVSAEYVDASAPSYDAPVAALMSKGVNCVLDEVSTTAMVASVGALRQEDPSVKIFTAFGSASPQVISEIGSGASGMYIVGPSLTPADASTSPAVRTIVAAINKYDPGAPISGYTPNIWATLQVALAAAKTVLANHQALTGQNEWTALDNMNGYQTGVLAPTSFSAGSSGAVTDPRVFNWGWTAWQVQPSGQTKILYTGWQQTSVAEINAIPAILKSLGGG
jgi:branched-chain amino acid transport system substrate-binding protein